MNLINKASQRTIERLKNRIQFLEKQNATLVKENSDLKGKIESYESIIEDLRKIESDYKSGINEMVSLKKMYQQAISEVAKLKATYSKEMKALLKQMRKYI